MLNAPARPAIPPAVAAVKARASASMLKVTIASVLGWGVLLSAGSVLVVQGGLTLAGALFGSFMSEPMILAMTSTGGVLLLGLGLGLLELKEIRVANMLPALIVAERQTAGRGRGNNAWWSSDGALTFSLLIDASGEELGPARVAWTLMGYARSSSSSTTATTTHSGPGWAGSSRPTSCT